MNDYWNCPTCKSDQNGPMWGSLSLCYRCHIGGMTTPESGDEYIGLNRLDHV